MIENASFQFVDQALPIRTNLTDAFRRSWNHIATPGSGWSGAERVAIAAHSRAAWECELCEKRKNAIGPNAVPEQHAATDCLPKVAIEAIHRITTDPGRLSEDWFRGLLADGLTDSQYAEIIGIIGTITSIDTCCRALGISNEPLPEPEPGGATGYRPERLKKGLSWLPLLMDNDLAPSETGLYGGVRPGVNVLRAMSVVPNEVRNLLQICAAMYLNDRDVLNIRATGGRAITRVQMEMLSSRVSLINECFY